MISIFFIKKNCSIIMCILFHVAGNIIRNCELMQLLVFILLINQKDAEGGFYQKFKVVFILQTKSTFQFIPSASNFEDEKVWTSRHHVPNINCWFLLAMTISNNPILVVLSWYNNGRGCHLSALRNDDDGAVIFRSFKLDFNLKHDLLKICY